MFRSTGIVVVAALLFISACASPGQSPLLPSDNGASSKPASHPQTTCWGIWNVSIDPETGKYEIIPLRQADFMANVTMFLQPPAGSLQNFILQNLVVDTLSMPGWILVDVDVGLKHPFPGLDQYTGFDVRGLFMHDCQYVASHDSNLLYAGVVKPRLLNADGYSRWMNPTEFTTTGILGFTPGKLGTTGFKPNATLNPYKYFTDGLDKDAPLEDFLADPVNAEKRGYFRPGSVNYRHYELIWPSVPLTFQYAVIASYDEPNPIPPDNIPDDFPITANCAEALHIVWTDNGSTAFYESPSSQGGDLHLKLEVFDWGVLGHGTDVTGEIGSITLESPLSLIASPITLDPSTLTASPGSTGVSSVYEIDIDDVNPSGLTYQTVLCRVTSKIHDSYDYGFGTDVPDAPLASYIVFDAPIKNSGAQPPVAIATACDCLWIAPGGSITFDGSQSYSPFGTITDWDWDFNGDGTYGDAHTGPDNHPTCVFNSPGTFNVDLKVTDSNGQSDTLDPSEKLAVHVGAYTPPIAISKIVPTIGFVDFAGDFVGSGSTGTINLYEWDFEGDCIWDYQHATIGDTTHEYTEADIYNAVLRVTGTGCDSVSTQVRMIDPLPILQNGNFWDGTWGAWTHGHGGAPVTYIEELQQNDTYKYNVHLYRCCTYDGGACYINQALDCDVSGYSSLYFNLFFKVTMDSLYGDGYMWGEPAMCVRMTYEDASATTWQAWWGWDPTFDGVWQWDTTGTYKPPAYVSYHFQDTIPLNTWVEKKTIDLMTIPQKPVKIKNILIGSYGWNFDSSIALPWFSES